MPPSRACGRLGQADRSLCRLRGESPVILRGGGTSDRSWPEVKTSVSAGHHVEVSVVVRRGNEPASLRALASPLRHCHHGGRGGDEKGSRLAALQN